MFGGTHPKFLEYRAKRVSRSRNKNGLINTSNIEDRNNFLNVNKKYIDPNYHMVFNSPEKNQSLENFDVKPMLEVFPNIKSDYFESYAQRAKKYKGALDTSGMLSKGYSLIPAIGTYGFINKKE